MRTRAFALAVAFLFAIPPASAAALQDGEQEAPVQPVAEEREAPAAEEGNAAETYTDANIMMPVAEIERVLRSGDFQILSAEDARFEGDRTQRTVLQLPDGQVMMVKWANAAEGGEAFNNSPRYEYAAYEFQKMFLDPTDYVVPPTELLAVPVERAEEVDEEVEPTFDEADESVVAVLQYWLFGVTNKNLFDEDRLENDPEYARALGDLNVFTYLAKHNDANLGNYLISQGPENPRLFAVDNGLAFGDEVSDRGYEWRELRVERCSEETIDALRKITREDLDRELGVLAQWEIQDDRLVRVEPTGNLHPEKGVRVQDGIVQFGLTRDEIAGVESRIKHLIRLVDQGEIETI